MAEILVLWRRLSLHNSPPDSRWWVPAFCAAGILIVFGPVFAAGFHNVKTSADDFLGLYAGARLVGTSGLYDAGEVARIQLETAGVTGPSLHFTRLPCFSLLLWPLAQLPYRTAHAVWYVLRFVAVAGFIVLWPHSRGSLTAVVCCWSLPLAAGLANGQDAPLLLFWLALSQRLEQKGCSFGSGLALSMCAAKFHLLLLLPLLLLRHRRWAVLAGGLAGGIGLAGLCFVAGGWDWPAHYLKALSDPAINPNQRIMPNLHGLLWGAPRWAEVGLSLATVLGALVCILWTDYLTGFTAALAGSLLLSYHAYTADAVVLIPALLIIIECSRVLVVRYAAFVLASPFPWLLLLKRR